MSITETELPFEVRRPHTVGPVRWCACTLPCRTWTAPTPLLDELVALEDVADCAGGRPRRVRKLAFEITVKSAWPPARIPAAKLYNPRGDLRIRGIGVV